MQRLVVFLIVVGAALYLAFAAAPLIIVGVAGLILLSWKRPETVGRFAARPQLARLPQRLRATPMRFAGSVAFGALILVGVMAPVGAAGRERGTAPTSPPVGPATSTSTPSVEPTTEQTTEPTPTTEPARTATPEPSERATPRQTTKPPATPAPGAEPTGPTESGTVVNVVDGDTIDVLVDGVEVRVRYIGMDTPEVHSGAEWLGPEASAANGALVEGEQVVLEKDVSETDRYGRALRYVWLETDSGWLLVNLELIRQGFASITTYPPDVKYVDLLYVDAQDEAQADARGLWGAAPAPAPTVAPAAATLAPTVAPAPAPILPVAPAANCDPSYPGICIPIGSADLDCGEIQWRRFAVAWNVPNPDPHGFDGNADGVGCES